jgi:hypothetical protein
MSSAIATAPANQSAFHQLGVYIPYVYTNVSKQMIADAFESQNVGKVGKIDLVAKKDPKTGRDYNNVYVHFTEWNSDEYSEQIQQALAHGKTFQFYYTLPSKGKKQQQKFFWNLQKNNFVKKTSESKQQQQQQKKDAEPDVEKHVVFVEPDDTTADDFEEIATEYDVPYGFMPIPDTTLVSADYVSYLEESQTYWRNQCAGYQDVINNLVQQMEFYKQKSDTLEQNIAAIEQNMREELDYEIQRIRGYEEEEDDEELEYEDDEY